MGEDGKMMAENKKRKHFTFPKPLIGIMFGLIFGLLFYVTFSVAEKAEMVEKNELAVVSGMLSDYAFYGKWHDNARFSIDGEGTYVLLDPARVKFNRKYFEQTTKIGECILLYVDRDAKGLAVHDGTIYEIWSDDVCYISYEDYVEANKSNKNELASAKWPLTIGTFCIGIFWAIDIWKKERKGCC